MRHSHSFSGHTRSLSGLSEIVSPEIMVIRTTRPLSLRMRTPSHHRSISASPGVYDEDEEYRQQQEHVLTQAPPTF
jgi:hypothetical protein